MKSYVIADRTFTQEELVLGQIQWLKQRLSKYPITSLTQEAVMGLVVDEGPALLAIVLIENGQTRADKVKAGMKGVEALESWLQQYATPEGILAIAADFFQLNRAALMRALTHVQDMTRTVIFGDGSTTPSSSSVTETSPSLAG